MNNWADKEWMDTSISHYLTCIIHVISFHVSLPAHLNGNHRATDRRSIFQRLHAGQLLWETCLPACCKRSAVLNHTDWLLRLCPCRSAENLVGFLAVDPWPCTLSFGLLCQCRIYFRGVSSVLWCSNRDDKAQRKSTHWIWKYCIHTIYTVCGFRLVYAHI